MRALMTWEVNPLSVIMTMAMYPSIARVAGMYYIDKTAEPDVEYDYRVVGYWADRTRYYTVHAISQPNTLPLGPVSFTTVRTPIPAGEIDGVTVYDDQTVGLRWTPPSYDPNAVLGVLDKIESVIFHLEHKVVEADSAGGCPSTTDDEGFMPAARRSYDDPKVDEPFAPVLPAPVSDKATGPYVWPEFFSYHHGLDYGCHAYRVYGQDVFGRLSPRSNKVLCKVVDQTPPPPPVLVRATVYQEDDKSLADATRKRFFPPIPGGSPGYGSRFVIHVSWMWPNDADMRAPDLKEFCIYVKHENFETFIQESDPEQWRSPAKWDLEVGDPVAKGDTSAMPSHLASLGLGVADRYYEVALNENHIASLADIGLDAGDSDPVRYAYVGVSSVDHDPYNNEGDVSAPVVVFARDLTAPAAPSPPPELSAGPFELDDQGNRSLQLSWNGVSKYTYGLWRADVVDLDVGDYTADDIPASCPTVEYPTSMPSAPQGEWQEQLRRFNIRMSAALNPNVFQAVSPMPISVSGFTATFIDTVDGTQSGEYVYAAVAVDKAGNVSELSCPGEVILVKDGLAPRAPVIRQALGGDNAILITWNTNPEGDLKLYNIYRTANQQYVSSRRKMVLIASLQNDGTDAPGDDLASDSATLGAAAPYTTLSLTDGAVVPGVKYYYRLEAVDLAGNRSELSGVASVSAYDEQAPAAPTWAATPWTISDTAVRELTVRLYWNAVSSDPALRIQVQRRQLDSQLWRSVGRWLAPGTLTASDSADIEAGASYVYRLRAMDSAGNRSPWSDEQEIHIPAP